MKNFKKGFTIIELLVVVAIIGLLSSIVLASLNDARTKANKAAFKSETSAYVPKGNNDCLGATLVPPTDTAVTDWDPSFTSDTCSSNGGTFSISANNLKVSGCKATITQDGASYTEC